MHRTSFESQSETFSSCNENFRGHRKVQDGLAALSAMSLLQLTLPFSAFAADINLGSSEATHKVDANYQGGVSLVINGESKPVVAGQALTGAEYATFVNALGGEKQTLTIGSSGGAIGGYLNLTPQLAQNTSGLVVPSNVNLFHDFGTGSALNFTGNLNNSGNFYALSTNTSVLNAVINAANLTNNQGALLTSMLPAAGLPGIGNAVQNLSLTLNVMNTLFNAGTISSAGNLTVNAGAIYNQLSANITGPSPIMQALGNLNLNATLGNITNSGTLAAITGNVNLASMNNLVVNNVGGSVQALLGSINVRDMLFSAKKDLTLTGGDWLSQELNLNSGSGDISANVEQLTGVLNATSHSLMVSTRTALFQIGQINATGDPLLVNQTGDLQITQSFTLFAPLSIMAAGNVTANSGVSINSRGEDVLVTAGGVIQIDSANNVTLFDRTAIAGQGGGGGNIDLTGVTNIFTGGQGGSFTFITLGGEVNAGTITIPTSINASGPTPSKTGITVISDASAGNVNSNTSISLGSFTTGTQNGAILTIAAAHPILNLAGGDCNPCIRVDSTGQLFAGSTITAGAPKPNMSITIGSIQSQDTNITLVGERVIVNGNLRDIRTSAASPAANVSISTNSALPFEVGVAGTANGVAGTVNLGTLGSGGLVPALFSVENLGTGGVKLNGAQMVLDTLAGPAANGASLSVSAPKGTIFIDQTNGDIRTNGLGTGNGGNITFSSQKISLTGASSVNLVSTAPGGAGGTVKITTTDVDSPLSFDGAAGSFSVLATGVTGGTLDVTSAGSLTLNTPAVNMAGSSNGSKYLLTTTSPSSNLLVIGDLTASGGLAAAGSILINSGSLQAFVMDKAGSAPNGVRGDITATAGSLVSPGGIIDVSASGGLTVASKITAFGNAPKVTITARGATGTTGLTIQDANLLTVNGSSPSLTLNSLVAPFAVTTPGTFFAAGGTFTLTATSLNAGTNFGVIVGTGGGTAGTVQITTTSPFYDLNFGGAGRILDARGGGGTVILRSAGNLTVDMSGILVAPFMSGRGGNLTFSAGGVSPNEIGNLQVNGTLSAGGFQGGGSVILSSNSPVPFTFNAGGVNAVTSGKIDVSSLFVEPGSISITNNGSGGINVPGPNVFDYTVINPVTFQGNGGKLTLNAPTGPVNIGGGTYDLSTPGGSINGSVGGTFSLVAKDFVPGGPITIRTNVGLGGGPILPRGGDITIIETGDAINDLVVAPGVLALEATGPVRGSITLSASKGLTVDVVAAKLSFAPGLGSGGTYSLTAGTLVTSSLTVIGTLDVSGIISDAGTVTLAASNNVSVGGLIDISVRVGAPANYNAGKLTITSNSQSDFLVFPGIITPVNGVAGPIFGFGAGDGGRVSITNFTGGIALSQIVLVSNNGNGGSLTLNAPNGVVQLPFTGGILDLNGTSTNGNGGKLDVTASKIFGNLEIQANSKGAGTGGTFKVVTTSPFDPLTVGTALRLSASSAATLPSLAPTVTLSSGADLTVDMTGVKVAATNGAGASYDFSAGNVNASPIAQLKITGPINASASGAGITASSGNITLRSSGDLSLAGNLVADGIGGTPGGPSGDGGKITVVSSSTKVFSVTSSGPVGPPNGVSGFIEAASLGSGAAGQVSLTAGLGGIYYDLASITLTTNNGAGGLFKLNSEGSVSLTSGTLSVRGVGGTAIAPSPGGTVSISGSSVTVIPGAHLFINANGGDFGNAGSVTLNAIGAGSIIKLSPAFDPGTFNISAATNNGAGGGVGNGGIVSVTAGLRVEVTPSLSTLNAMGGPNGNSPIISLSATGQAGGCCGEVFVNGPLTAYQDQGAIFNISVNSATAFVIGSPTQMNGIAGGVDLSGSQNVSTGGFVGGGSLIVENKGTGGITLSANTNILSVGGTNNAYAGGGTVRLLAGTGVLTLSNNVINVDGGFTPPAVNPNMIPGSSAASGGEVTLRGANIVSTPGSPVPLQISARGGSGGRGGVIDIKNDNNFTNIVIGNAPGQISILATGGAKGGDIHLQSGANVSVVASSLLFNTTSATNGDGGKISIVAGMNVQWTGALNVSGVGIGDGGSVTINQGSSSFSINQNGFNGITGALTFSTGNVGGSGGTFSLISNGSLSVPGNTTLAANGFTNGLGGTGINAPKFTGGAITLKVPSVLVQGAGILAFNASGAGSGNGGSIDFATNFQNINVGGASPLFSFLANGGSAGSIAGDGGSIKLATAASINVADTNLVNALPTGKNGKGASYDLTSTGFGTIAYNGDIQAQGAGLADGGAIRIVQGAFTSLAIGAGATNGINGTIRANAGVLGGKGGTIFVQAGSIVAGSTALIQASGTSSDGGQIDIIANTLTSASSSGVGPNIQADSALTGKGGVINISVASGNFSIGGNTSGQFTVTARGGSKATLAGNGGSISVSAQNIIVDPIALSVAVTGSGGNGGTLKLTATGNVQVAGGLSVNAGAIIGAGGRIEVTTGSGSIFQINNGASPNGIAGDLTANANSVQRGGDIVIKSLSSGITVGGSAKLDVGSKAGNAGTISLEANNGVVSVLAPGLNADGIVGDGGSIALTGSSITGPNSGALVLTANGGFRGNGGLIFVKTTAINASGSLTTGKSTGQLQIEAKGGVVAGGTTRGGTADIRSAGTDLIINLPGLNVSPNNSNGDGGTVMLTAGSNVASPSGNLFVNGTLDVSGSGRGNGGNITLNAKGPNTFTIGSAVVNGVAGTLIANAGSVAGNGGNISIEQSSANSNGGILVASGQNLFVNGTADGSAGFIGITAKGLLPIQFAGATSFSANGSGVLGNAGGISLSAARYVFGGNNISVSAKGGSAANGGIVTILSTGTAGNASDLLIGTVGTNQFTINADGGSIGSAGGNAGSVSLGVASASNVVSVTSGLSLNPLGVVGNGGRLTVSGAGSVLFSGPLSLNGGTLSGKGGAVSITSGSTASAFTVGSAAVNGVNGSLTVNAGSSIGEGGQITLISTSSTGITLTGGAPVLLASPGTTGKGGSFVLSATTGTINLGSTNNPLTANGGINSDGGSITLNASVLTFDPAANPLLSAQGGLSSGNGGVVSVTTTNAASPISLAATPGNMKIDVSSPVLSSGGQINLTSAGAIKMDGFAVTVNRALGGTIKALSGTGGIGNITVTGVLSAGFSKSALLDLQTAGFGNSLVAPGAILFGRTVSIKTTGAAGTAAAPLFVLAVAQNGAGISVQTTAAGTGIFLTTQGVQTIFQSGGSASTFSLTSSGDVIVTGSGISGGNLNQITLTTTANNGRIQLNGDVSGSIFGSSALLSANGLGAITGGSGVIKTGTINLTTGGIGGIGQQFAPVATTATNISVSTTGSAFIFSAAPSTVSLNTSSAAVLELSACAGITVSGNQSTPTLTLGSIGGDINASGSVLNGAGSVGITAATNATLSTSGALVLNSVTVSNNFNATASGSMTVSGAMQVGNASLTVNGANSTITVNQPIAANASTANTTPTITISGTGNIAINGALTANRVNVTTSGGAATNVTLNENITTFGAGNQVSLGSFGGANLLRTNGTVTANQLSVTFAGGVGQPGNRIVTDVNVLDLSGFGAANNVFIQAANGVTLGSSGSVSVGGTFDLLVNAGQLTFQSVNAGGPVTFLKNGNTGSIMQNANGSASSATGGVSLTTSDAAVPIILLGSLSASGAGNMTITSANAVTAGALSVSNGSLSVQANNGAITINQSVSVTGGNLTLNASSVGGITTGAGGSLTANNGNVVLLTFDAANGGISLGAPVSASSFGPTHTISITSAKNVTAAAITDNNGSVTVNGNSGVLQFNSSVNVSNGDLTIRQFGILSGDRIVFGNSANISAVAPAPGLGNISVAVSDTAVGTVPGTPPTGGTVNPIIQSGGQINYGPVQFTNTGFTTLLAKGANITFFVKAGAGAGASAITLNSNFFFADPPAAGVASPVIAPVMVPFGAPVMPVPPSMQPSGLAPLTQSVSPASHGAVPAQSVSLPIQSLSPIMYPAPASVEITGPIFVSPAGAHGENGVQQSNHDSPVQPAALQRRTSTETVVQTPETNLVSVLTGFVSKKAGLFGGAPVYMRSARQAVVQNLDETTFDLSQGEIVVSAAKRSRVNAGEHTIEASPGSIVHVTRRGAVLVVRNLCDSASKSVKVTVAGKVVHISAGEEVVVGLNDGTVESALKGDNVGRRNVNRFVIDGKHAMIKSELSIISLIQQSNLLTTMYTKGSVADRSLMERVMKMAAALFQITGKRGAYSAYESSRGQGPIPLRSDGEPAQKIAVLR